MRDQAGGPDSGGAREGRKVAAREVDSGPRVSLVPAAGDGTIDSLSSTAETRRVEIGRTTLMGLPSPLADREKSTSPGHDVHLPGDTQKTADTPRNEQSRPVATTGVIPAVEMDGSATRRLDDVGLGRGQPAQRPRPETKPTPVDRTIAGAAVTFRAGRKADARLDLPLEGRRNRGLDRPPPPDTGDEPGPNRFVTALVVGVSLSVGFGIVVQGFIRSRVRGAHTYEAMETIRPLPSVPASSGPERLDPFPAPANLAPAPPPPAVLDEPAPALAPQPAEAVEPTPSELAEPSLEPEAKPDGKVDRRAAARAKVGVTAGRPAPAPRPNTMAQRPNAPVVVPSASPAPGTTPLAAPPTQPPPQNAAPKADQPKPTYDPDLPMPPSAE